MDEQPIVSASADPGTIGLLMRRSRSGVAEPVTPGRQKLTEDRGACETLGAHASTKRPEAALWTRSE